MMVDDGGESVRPTWGDTAVVPVDCAAFCWLIQKGRILIFSDKLLKIKWVNNLVKWRKVSIKDKTQYRLRMSGMVPAAAAEFDAAAATAPGSSARPRPVASITSRSVSETCNGEWDGKMDILRLLWIRVGLSARHSVRGNAASLWCKSMREVVRWSPRGAKLQIYLNFLKTTESDLVWLLSKIKTVAFPFHLKVCTVEAFLL